jgi:hypothetical protein
MIELEEQRVLEVHAMQLYFPKNVPPPSWNPKFYDSFHRPNSLPVDPTPSQFNPTHTLTKV